MHRDLKPDNILVKNKDLFEIKVADFGFARYVGHNQMLTLELGTPNYIAPEILHNLPYNSKIDIWSFGIIIY